MSKNGERLIMRWLGEMEKQQEAPKARFRHYVAKIGPNFHPESAHGTEIPWDGNGIAWDGTRETSHGCAGTPLRGASATPKTRTATPSALTVCQIAHSGAQGETWGRHGGRRQPRRVHGATMRREECRSGAGAPSCERQESRGGAAPRAGETR